jgi:hypothetical protein
VQTQEYLDGNDLAGVARELFTVDVTSAAGQCAGCGLVSRVGEAHVYNRAPGMVLRCPACDNVLMRLVRAPGRAWLDLRGVSCLQLTLPD